MYGLIVFAEVPSCVSKNVVVRSLCRDGKNETAHLLPLHVFLHPWPNRANDPVRKLRFALVGEIKDVPVAVKISPYVWSLLVLSTADSLPRAD